MARLAGILSTALITAGLVVLCDVGLTLAWEEPLSSLYGSIEQGEAADELVRLEASYPTAADLESIAAVRGSLPRVRVLARRFEAKARDGRALGRIVAPAMDLDIVFVEGTDTASLRRGPGHYPKTPLPGEGGTAAIAGHRTTYLAPFRHIDSLQPDDEIRIEMPYATLFYRVEKTRIVDPSNVGVVRGTGYQRLVLSACNPLYSAAERFIVFARLERATVFDARQTPPWPAS